MEPVRGRLAPLDGLRGWAALSVVIYHLCWESFGVAFPVFRSGLPSFLGNGSLAVAIFFALSGYVLTIRRWRSPDNGNLLLTLLRRYLRLTLPILAIVLIVWALMSLRLTPTTAAAARIHREDWLGTFANFDPDFVDALGFATVRTYWIAFTHNYGPFLWTMIVELAGSLIVLTLSWRSRRVLLPYVILVGLTAAMLWKFPLGASLPAGALVALLQRDRVIFTNAPGPRESGIATAGLAVALLAAGFCQIAFASLLPPALLGMLVFVFTLRSLPALAFLSAGLSAWLGRLSFPIYLIQYPVLIAPVSWLILVTGNAALLTPWTALGIIIVSVVLVLAAAMLFYPVERLTLQLLRGPHRRPQPVAPVLAPAPATGKP